MKKRQGNKKQKKKKSKLFKISVGVLISLVVFLIIGGAVGAGTFYRYAKQAPKLDENKLTTIPSTKIYDAKGNLFYTLGETKTDIITSKEIPKQLKQAIIAIEDKRYEEHKGIDVKRILGALASNLSNGEGGSLQGGSTLTQQLIKLSFFSTSEKDQTLKRKAQEAWLAIQLEKEKSKDEILTLYINKIYMSNGLYGMKSAAINLFGKSLNELSLAQYALLAGIPQAPSDYDPILHPEIAKKRRDLVLRQMHEDQIITKEEYETSVKEPVEVKHQLNEDEQQRVVDNYVKEVIKEAQEKTEADVYTGGLSIYTNIDLTTQNHLYQVVNTNEKINFPNDEVQVGITVLDPKTGQVMSQIGGRKVADNVRLGMNLATEIKRDFASTVKPINDYSLAIDQLNYSTARIIADTPYTYPETKIKVNNYDYNYLGNITMRQALVDSRNVPAVKTLEAVGLDKLTEFHKKIGLYDSEFPTVYANAIQLETNSLEMAGAYAVLSNGGTYYKPSYINRIEITDGTSLVFDNKGERVLKESTAYMMTDMLKDVLKRGTGTSADIPNIFHAGKTGTSNYSATDYEKIIGNKYGVPNVSFVGYTKDYVIAIWIGYENYFKALSNEEQGLAMSIYKEIMSYLSKGKDASDWKMPKGVVRLNGELYVEGHLNNGHSAPVKNPAPVPVAPQVPSTQPAPQKESPKVVTPKPPVTTPPSATKPVENPPTSSVVPPEVSKPAEPQVPETPQVPEVPKPPEESGNGEAQLELTPPPSS